MRPVDLKTKQHVTSQKVKPKHPAGDEWHGAELHHKALHFQACLSKWMLAAAAALAEANVIYLNLAEQHSPGMLMQKGVWESKDTPAHLWKLRRLAGHPFCFKLTGN